MSTTSCAKSLPAASLEATNERLAGYTAMERVTWAAEHLPPAPVLTSSFGAQAAVSLHLVTGVLPNIPVVLIDTGYLFPETYRFVDELVERLRLNLHVYRPALSAAWQEARYGQLWEQGADGIERYNELNKLEPMRRALDELRVGTWIAGLRRAQAATREDASVLERRDGHYKLHPIVDWSDRDVYRYLRRHDLPYHPLWHRGYISIGDWHTSHPVGPDGPDHTRFFGLRRECGLHQMG